MNIAKMTRLIVASLSIVGLTGSFVSPAYADNNRLVQRLLLEMGLDPLQCGTMGSEISIYDEKDDNRTCARSTAQYPAGSYFFDRGSYSIRRLGGEATATAPAASAQPAVTQPSYQTSNPTYQGGPYPGSYPGVGGTYPPLVMPTLALGPTIFVSSNPSVPVDPTISAQISASLAARGLTLASCSANPGVVVLVGGYTACAYPTPSYPPGRYSLVLQ